MKHQNTTNTPANEINENSLYTNLLQNGNVDLYDTLTLHREHLEYLQTLIMQAQSELKELQGYEYSPAKKLLGIAQHLTFSFLDDTQFQIDKIESVAPTATDTKQ